MHKMKMDARGGREAGIKGSRLINQEAGLEQDREGEGRVG